MNIKFGVKNVLNFSAEVAQIICQQQLIIQFNSIQLLYFSDWCLIKLAQSLPGYSTVECAQIAALGGRGGVGPTSRLKIKNYKNLQLSFTFFSHFWASVALQFSWLGSWPWDISVCRLGGAKERLDEELGA